jgi:hypothetical protein
MTIMTPAPAMPPKVVPDFRIEVALHDPCVKSPAPVVGGTLQRSAGADGYADQEENCVRMAENMVREMFRRFREKQALARAELKDWVAKNSTEFT